MKHNYIEQAEAALLHTYNRYQIVLEKGEDVYLYDAEGKLIARTALKDCRYANRQWTK